MFRFDKDEAVATAIADDESDGSDRGRKTKTTNGGNAQEQNGDLWEVWAL